MNVDAEFHRAVQHYWTARAKQQAKQIEGGKIDAGTRGAATGGTQMEAVATLAAEILVAAGLKQSDVKTRTALELPGYYRPEKKWDLVAVSGRRLVCACEFKSQVGPSFGNNFNNRAEEAIGSAVDVWTAYREGRFGSSPEPFLGYFFLLEDCAAVDRPIRNNEPRFEIDPEFKGASYKKRYELLCRRLVLERLYRGACLTFATNETPTKISHPAEDLTFQRFAAALRGCAATFLGS